jgi:hypothetical protein
MELKAGSRLGSVTDATQVVVVKAPAGDVDVRCGGHPMVPAGTDAPSATVEPGFDTGTQIGKRYADEAIGIELLCTKPGDGSLSIGSDVLVTKTAKPLPASD